MTDIHYTVKFHAAGHVKSNDLHHFITEVPGPVKVLGADLIDGEGTTLAFQEFDPNTLEVWWQLQTELWPANPYHWDSFEVYVDRIEF